MQIIFNAKKYPALWQIYQIGRIGISAKLAKK